MTTIINRLYAAKEQVAGALDALERVGLGPNDVSVVSATGGQGAKTADLAELIEKGGTPPSDVAAYAEKLRHGGSLVTVRAPWGYAVTVMNILERFEPVDTGIHRSEYHFSPGWHEAAPLSALLGLPVLSRSKSSTALMNNPAPLSSLFGLPTLSNSKSSTRLLNNPTPLSSLLGLPVLSHAKPVSSLSKSDKPFSSLINDPAPLSRLLNLPVLIDD
jgi:hypothetical protein